MGIKEVKGNLRGFLPTDLQEAEETFELTFDQNPIEGENGQLYYVATTSAPNMTSFNFVDNKFDIQIEAKTEGGKVRQISSRSTEDELLEGEAALIEDLSLKVKETNPPSIAFASNTSSYSGTPQLEFTVSDVTNEDEPIYVNSGINTQEVSVGLFFKQSDGNEQQISTESDSLSAQVLTNEYDNNFKIKYTYTRNTKLTETGIYIFKVSVKDNDGNIGQNIQELNVDVTAPNVTVETEIPGVANGYTQNKQITIKGTFDLNDTDSLTAKVVSATGETTNYEHNQFAITGNSYSLTINLYEGKNTITVAAKDNGGNTGITPELIITLDSSIPKFDRIVVEQLVDDSVNANGSLTIRVYISSVYDNE